MDSPFNDKTVKFNKSFFYPDRKYLDYRSKNPDLQ
jgi:hypothetical protein